MTNTGTRARPHNSKSPIDLRIRPVCYLCGGHWTRWHDIRPVRMRGKRWELPTWRVVVQCTRCLLLTYAYADKAVMHSRWEWHGPKRARRSK